MTIARKHLIVFLLFLFGALELVAFTPAMPVQADESLFNSQIGINDVGQVYGNQKQDIRVLVGKIVNIALGFLATIFLVIAVFAGFQYMTSGGNEEKTKKAIALLKNAIIGLAIVLLAWAITKFVIIMLSRAARNAVDYTHYNNGTGPNY